MLENKREGCEKYPDKFKEEIKEDTAIYLLNDE